MPELLVVTPTFFPELVGTPHYITDLVRWLDEAGWDVTVVTGQPFYPEYRRHDGYGRSKRHDQVGNARVHRLPTIVPRAGASAWRVVNESNFLAQGLIARARGQVKQIGNVLSVSAGTPGTVILGRHLIAPGGRHVALVHDIQTGLAAALGMASTRAVAAIRRFECHALAQADEIRVLSDEMADVLRSMGVSKPIGVSPVWATVSPPATAVTGGPLVQYSGSLSRKQGVSQLLDLAERLRTALPGERLLVRGSGSMLSALRDATEAGGLTNIVLEPLVPHDELARALAASPIHIVPQLPGCADYVVPSKVINALAVGSVVVAAAPPGSALARMGRESPALRCVAPGDVDAMAREIVALSRDRSALANLREQASEHAANTFDRQRILADIVAVLDVRV